MSNDFETYTRAKIGALRAEADQLERLLADFFKTQRRVETATPEAPAVLRDPQAANERVVQEPRRRGHSVFGKVVDAIYAVGPVGMSLDEMMAVAEREGAPTARSTLRSQVWHEKKKGRLVPVAHGRYAAADNTSPKADTDLLAR